MKAQSSESLQNIIEQGGDTSNHSKSVPNVNPLSGWRLAIVTISLALGMFLVGIDTSIIGVAIPRITSSFHALNDISWYGSAYMLPCMVLQPSFAVMFKSFSVTYVYMTSIALFEGMIS